jgi:type I site-specific restriction endonuclease
LAFTIAHLSNFLIFFVLSCRPPKSSREKIDALLQQCGWVPQKRTTISLSCSRGIVIREALLKDCDEVDYLFFIDGKAIATVEAKPLFTEISFLAAP